MARTSRRLLPLSVRGSRPAAGPGDGGGGSRRRRQTTGLKGLGGPVLKADLNADSLPSMRSGSTYIRRCMCPKRLQNQRLYLNNFVRAETSVALGHNQVEAISRLQVLRCYQSEAQNYRGSYVSEGVIAVVLRHLYGKSSWKTPLEEVAPYRGSSSKLYRYKQASTKGKRGIFAF